MGGLAVECLPGGKLFSFHCASAFPRGAGRRSIGLTRGDWGGGGGSTPTDGDLRRCAVREFSSYFCDKT